MRSDLWPGCAGRIQREQIALSALTLPTNKARRSTTTADPTCNDVADRPARYCSPTPPSPRLSIINEDEAGTTRSKPEGSRETAELQPASFLMRSARRPNASFTYSNTLGSAPCARRELLKLSRSESHWRCSLFISLT